MKVACVPLKSRLGVWPGIIGLVPCCGVAGLEWAAAALEELLVLGAWIRMLRARHARELGYTCTG